MIVENLGKLQPKADIGISLDMFPHNRKKDFRIYNRHTRRIIGTIHVDLMSLPRWLLNQQSGLYASFMKMTPVSISSGLVQTLLLQQPFVPPTRSDWIFYVSTNLIKCIDSPSNSPTTQGTQNPIISHDVEEDNHDIEVAHMYSDSVLGIPIPEVPSDQSSSNLCKRNFMTLNSVSLGTFDPPPDKALCHIS
ncbi:hypothetical protein Tco_0155959 [Tanacetum coccineum]